MTIVVATLPFVAMSDAWGKDELPLIAVYGAESKSGALDADGAKLLTFAVEDAILRTERFRVVSRSDMDRVRIEQEAEFQVSDNCRKEGGDAIACYAEIGGALGAHEIVIAEVLRVGTEWHLIAKRVDMQTLENRGSGKAQCAGGVQCVLTIVNDAVRQMVKLRDDPGGGVVEVLPPPVREIPPQPTGDAPDTTGFLSIESSPSGATVYLDGEERGRTPYEAEVAVGTYAIRIEQPLYRPTRAQLTLTPEGKRLRVTLDPDFGALIVTSEPSGAAITLNGEPTGKVTPHTFRQKPAGTYTVTLTQDLYRSAEQTVRLAAGATERVTHTLAPNFGALTVTSEPSGATVVLDGRSVQATTPTTVDRVPAGAHRVEARLARHHPAGATVTVTPGGHARTAMTLEGKYGQLAVTATVRERDGTTAPAKAGVLLDGGTIGSTPLKRRLLEGQYRLRLDLAAIVPYETSISITEGKRTDVAAALRRGGSGPNGTFVPEDIGTQLIAEPLRPELIAETEEEFKFGFKFGCGSSGGALCDTKLLIGGIGSMAGLGTMLIGLIVPVTNNTSGDEYVIAGAAILGGSVAIFTLLSMIDGSEEYTVKNSEAIRENARRRREWEAELARVRAHNAPVEAAVRRANTELAESR